MTTDTLIKKNKPAPSFSQIVEGVKKLSKSELETLALLLDKEAGETIRKSVQEMKRGKMREL